MAKIIQQRMCARLDGDFVIFLIGMRINKFWKIHRWLPVARAMPRMLAELEARPESGFLGCEQALGNPSLMVQYWRSLEHLLTYARAQDGEHFPAWKEFNRRVGSNGDVGIWHETYLVSAGRYESIYNNMPPFGLGKIGELLPATGHRQSARERISAPS